MDSLLKHMVDMTGHRDHAMLDMSAISAVQDLSGADQTRIYSVSTVAGQRYLRPRASIVGHDAARLDEPADTAPGMPLDACPELARCIAQHHATAASTLVERDPAHDRRHRRGLP
jgi:hypothetical protein